jgi:hypothetical protein
MRPAILLLLLCLTACSGNDAATDAVVSDARTGDGGDVEVVERCVPFKVVGQPCDDACECLGGLCLLNEYAPFRYCTRPCKDAAPGSPCAPEAEGAPWTSLCVQFPASEFRVEPSRFCAPLCTDMGDCAALGAPWETCQQPLWLGNPLYPGIPDKVCISPSAQGHDPIDPESCEGWEPLYTEFELERMTCTEYCEFLETCQLLKSSTSATCCAFHCTSAMVPGGKVDKAYFQEIRCYVDTYLGFQGTALVCTQPLTQCGDEPDQP